MGDNWGADLIPLHSSGRINLVEALSVAQHLPAEALDEAARRPAAIADAVLAVVERAGSGEALGSREQNLLFWGIHALGQARETRLCAPLLRLLRLPADRLEELLQDAATATLPRIVAGVFDGDVAALHGAIADGDIDEFVRWSLFGALTFLTFDGRTDRANTATFLNRFDDQRLARAGDAAWNGWAEAIALLGLLDLSDRVETAFAEARLLEDALDRPAFAARLAGARADPRDEAPFEASRLGYLDDAVASLDEMLSAGADEDAPAVEPVHNPLRRVGRNDPCPCGSGRKYKKCCLPR